MAKRYRIHWHWNGWEPQMRYMAPRLGREVWQPLRPNGYWADPAAYSHGNVQTHVRMSRREAKVAILRAMSINEENVREVKRDG